MNKFLVFLMKFVRGAARPFFPTKVYGERNIENKKSLIVGNHVSGWDPLVYTMWMKNIVSFVYKAEFDKILFLRWVFEGLDCIPVHRGEVDMNASKKILTLLKQDRPVCLFPEGTRNPTVDCLQPFHTGVALFAIKTKAPIRPFYIWDKTKFLRKNYMIVGDEFDLQQFYGRSLDKQTLEEATEVVRAHVDELRVKLNAILAEKGVKRRKRTKKELEKLRLYNEAHAASAQPDSAAAQSDSAAQPAETSIAEVQSAETPSALDIQPAAAQPVNGGTDE